MVALTLQPIQPGSYTFYVTTAPGDGYEDCNFNGSGSAAASARQKPQHTYVPFKSLPCIADHLRHSPEWLTEQEILRKVSHCILTPGTKESDIIAALENVERHFGLVNMSARMAQPMLVRGAPGAFGGESEIRVTDVFAPVRVIPAAAAAAMASPQALEILSPLHAAVMAGKVQVAHHLLTGPMGAGSGADVNQPSEWSGRTAIMIAASLGNYDAVDLLLDYDANLLQVDADGNTALIYAVAAANVPSASVVRRLLAECPELVDSRALPYGAYTTPMNFWRNTLRAVRENIKKRSGEAGLFIIWRDIEDIEDAVLGACAKRCGGGAATKATTKLPLGFIGAFSGLRSGPGANFQRLL